MSSMSRRRFLALVGAVAAATGLPPAHVAAALQSAPRSGGNGLTTLDRTLRPGTVVRQGTLTAYRAITEQDGEPHLVRGELAEPQPDREQRRRSLVHLLHLTDQHITDAQAPTRLESVREPVRDCEESDLPSVSAHRHQEVASARIVDAMNARARAIGFSPVTGAPIQAAITTGDNIDNAQGNELDLIIQLMNGGRVAPNSGAMTTYEGVQNSRNPVFWHPNGEIEDLVRSEHGFPRVPGFLDDCLDEFDAVGVGVPWYTCYGNHDALIQGNFPLDDNARLNEHLVGDQKLTGFPEVAEGTDTCSLLPLMLGVAAVGGVRALVEDAPTTTVAPDPARAFADRRRYVQAHLDSPGLPTGHGFTAANLGQTEADSRLYYTADVGATRWIVLDTTNPGGLPNGSIGSMQLAWLEEELTRADRERKLVLLFSHHGLRSLDNNIDVSLLFGADYSPSTVDPVRQTAGPVERLVERHPSVVAWINGHSHVNTITARDGFWDIGTAAHIDWPGQARLVEVVDNLDGTLSILCTMIDHEGEGDHDLAGTARELGMNEPRVGLGTLTANVAPRGAGSLRDLSATTAAQTRGGSFGRGTGEPEDRNVELLLPNPFPTERSSSRRVAAPLATAGLGTSSLSIAGALAVGAGVGLKRLRERGTGPRRQVPIER